MSICFSFFLCVFPQVYMWVGTQTSQVEIKLSLKACQVSLFVCVCASLPVCLFFSFMRVFAFLSSKVLVSYIHILLTRLPLIFRFTSSTCALKTLNTPGSCDWSEREMSPTASRAASTPGGLSKLPPHRRTRTETLTNASNVYAAM